MWLIALAVPEVEVLVVMSGYARVRPAWVRHSSSPSGRSLRERDYARRRPSAKKR